MIYKKTHLNVLTTTAPVVELSVLRKYLKICHLIPSIGLGRHTTTYSTKISKTNQSSLKFFKKFRINFSIFREQRLFQ